MIKGQYIPQIQDVPTLFAYAFRAILFYIIEHCKQGCAQRNPARPGQEKGARRSLAHYIEGDTPYHYEHMSISTQADTGRRSLTLGIMGGLGPLACAFFYERLILLSNASKDQDHIKVILLSDPEIPSRIDHLLGHGPNPAPVLQRVARQLEEWGVDVLVMPSTTTHAYYQEVANSVQIPVINLLDEIGRYLHQHGYQRPAFLPTAGTTQRRLFDVYLYPGTIPVYPSPEIQSEIQGVIDAVKAGRPLEALRSSIEAILNKDWAMDADCFVLACTELPVVCPDKLPLHPIISITDVLAQAVITSCERGHIPSWTR